MSNELGKNIVPSQVVRVKIKQVRDQLEASGEHNKKALQQATEFLQDEWESFQHLNRAGYRLKKAFDSAWKHLTGKKS